MTLSTRGSLAVVVGLFAFGIAGEAGAESVRFYDLEGFGHFLDGNPETTAVTEDGAIALPPPTHERYADAAAVFSAATARGDEVIVARVDDAQVVAIDRAGKTRPLFKAAETLVTALLVRGDDLFVATGAPAKIYRVGKDGKSELYYAPDAGYVWDLATGPHGSLLAATGEPGTVVRIDKKKSGKVLFKPEQKHMRSLHYDAKLGIFVGGGERGIVYRAADGKTFRALFDTGHTEVTAITTADSYVFVAGVSGAEALADGDKASGKDKVTVRSQLVRVAMDGASEVLAGSNDEAVFDLAVNERGEVLVATGATGRDDPRGRVYSVEPGRRVISLLVQSPSRRVSRLVATGAHSFAMVAAAGGRVVDIGRGYAKQGVFLTTPYDAGINSRFGMAQLFGNWSKGTQASLAVRSGQTAQPDDTWSDWSKEVEAPGNQRAEVPNGRYMQMRVTLKGDGAKTPTVYRMRLAYLRQNLPPFVRDVSAMPKGVALLPVVQEQPKSKTINLDKPPADRDGDDDGMRTRARQIDEPGALTLRWVADDPNGDDLRYNVDYRSAGGGDWQPLKEELDQPFITLNSSQLPDGHYQFRVSASDAPSNPDGLERTDARESRDVLVDNTPPNIDPLAVEMRGRRVTVRGVVADAVGPLVAASYSLDAKDPKPILPDDGVLDGPGESFAIHLGQLAPGQHLLTVRVSDEADNEAVAEARFIVR